MTADTPMLTELKTRARLRLNAVRRADAVAAAAPAQAGALRLRHCLNQAAREVGFSHWDHARHVLGGQAVRGEDQGRFWHAPRCSNLLNQWFADYGQARVALAAAGLGFLLPYRRQFVLVQGDFITELGLDPADGAWAGAQHDLVGAYGSAAWLALAERRLKAPHAAFG